MLLIVDNNVFLMFIKWLKTKNEVKLIKLINFIMYKSCKNRYITN